MRPVRSIALAATILLAAPLVLAQDPEGSQASVCPEGMTRMPAVGLVCPRSSGLYEVFTDDLVSVGFTHGADPVGDSEPVLVEGGTTPACVAPSAGAYYVQVIYARAVNDDDRYATKVGTIRALVGAANSIIDTDASATGGRADIRVACSGSTIDVRNVVLPTLRDNAEFSNIVADLRAAGYNDPRVKYWVYYDHQVVGPAAGIGHLYQDDRLILGNYNNGNGVSMFAVNFGYDQVRVWLHELGHTMGAVQDSAPHSTLAGHCYDGHDIMCYDDDGPRGHLYSTGYCPSDVFDCRKDDYFHVNPAPGSYLATHWNIASGLNRYLRVTGGPDSTPPELRITEPGDSSVRDGCAGTTVRFPLFLVGARFDPVFVDRGCVKGVATDAGSGLSRVSAYLDGELVGSTTASSFAFEFDITRVSGDAELRVVATDNRGNQATDTRNVMTVMS